ncbi:hypothetical protein COOONC_08363 [Cooperia oncophora]
MIGKVLLLAFVFDSAISLTERGRVALLKAHRGIDLEKRHDRLRNLGSRGIGRKLKENPILANATASNDEMVGANIPKLEDGASIEEVNRVEGVDEYLFDADVILSE